MLKKTIAAVTGMAMLFGGAGIVAPSAEESSDTTRYYLTEPYRVSGVNVYDQTDTSINSPQIRVTAGEIAEVIVEAPNLSEVHCASVTYAQNGGTLDIKMTALDSEDDEEGTLLVETQLTDLAADWKTRTTQNYRFKEAVPESTQYLKLEFSTEGSRDNYGFIDYVDTSKLMLVNLSSAVNGKVIDVTDSGTANGNLITASDSDPDKLSQNWKIEAIDDSGWYYIVNENSGKGIGMLAGTVSAGEQPVQWDCDGSLNQFWRFVEVDKDGETYYKIINKNSKLVLTVNDTTVTQEEWTGADNQLWKADVVFGEFTAGRPYDDDYSITNMTAEAVDNVISYSVIYTSGEGMVLEVSLSDGQTTEGGNGTFTVSGDGEYTLTASLYSDSTKQTKVCEDMSKTITLTDGDYTFDGAEWISSSEDQYWVNHGEIEMRDVTEEEIETIKEESEIYIYADQNTRYQTMDDQPWGGCFADAGWNAMRDLTDEQKKEVVGYLYGPGEDSLNFTAGRTPMGANDYGIGHYTYDETVDDYDLSDFSTECDEEYLIPYIETALEYVPDMQIFASPWTPPSWMKTNNQLTGYYDWPYIEDTPENFEAYANYFVKYLEEYAERGIEIHAVTPQNEPTMRTAYPSCVWTGEQLNVFLRDYLCDAIDEYNAENGKDVEVWLGTFTDSQKSLAMPTLKDPETSQRIGAVCFQWWGAPLATEVHMTTPELKLVQSETKCGNSLNNWQYAEEQFDCFKEFLDAGVSQYFLWNMILEPEGRNNALGGSWKQNAAITVDGTTVRLNPSYYLTKHFSSNIDGGARRIKVEGKNIGEGSVSDYVQDVRAIGFQNTDGEIVLNVKNSTSVARTATIIVNDKAFEISLPAHSINTFKMDGTYEDTPDATEVVEIEESTSAKFTNLATEFMLSCEGYDNGADVTTKTNIGESYQTWNLVQAEDGTYFLQNFRSDLVLCVWNGSKDEDAKISQYTNTNAGDQMWELRFIEYRDNVPYYEIINKNSGLALTALGEEDGYLVTQRTFDGGDDQLWSLTITGGEWEFPEDPGAEATEDPGDQPTEDPGDEPTEDPGDEATEDPGDQPTEEPENKPSVSTEVTSDGSVYTVTAALSNVDQSNTVIIAAYSEDGRCVSLAISTAEEETVTETFDAGEDISYFKVMVWDSMSGMKNITECAEIKAA